MTLATTAPISTARLERALRTCAVVVAARGGEAYVALFERLEAELADRARRQDARDRAKALLVGGSSIDQTVRGQAT